MRLGECLLFRLVPWDLPLNDVGTIAAAKPQPVAESAIIVMESALTPQRKPASRC